MRRVKGSRGGLGGKGGLGLARSRAGGWSRRGEEGWSDREQGDGEAKGGRRNAACLSLPYSLSLYLFSPSNIHTHTHTHELGGRHQNPESLR